MEDGGKVGRKADMTAIRPGACPSPPSPPSPPESTVRHVTALSALESDVGETRAFATLNYLSPPLFEERRRVREGRSAEGKTKGDGRL